MVEVSVDNLIRATGQPGNPYQDAATTEIVGDRKRDKKLIYWKKCPGCATHGSSLGYIMIGPYPNQFALAESWEFSNSKHAQQLSREYVRPGPGGIHPNDELTNSVTRWNPLIRNGGLKEMPIAQMIEYNWHRIPAFQELFPELKDVVDIPCEYGCPQTGPNARIFTHPEHYKNHVSVAHKDIQAPKAIGDAVREAITHVVGQSNSNMDPASLASIITAVMENMEKRTTK